MSRRAELRRERRRHRDRAVLARVVRHIEARALPSHRPRSLPWLVVAAVSGSAAAHAALLIPDRDREPAPEPRRVAVAVTRPAPEPVAPAPEPELPAPEPELPAKIEPAPKPKPEPAPRPKPTRSPPQPEQIAAAEPVAEPTAPPPPPVVGIDLGSTVSAGSGPAFAAGTTRAGTTERRAHDPRSLPATTAPPPSEPAPNRAATRIPGAGPATAELIKPERLRELEPDYPEELEAQGIEDDVTVSVTLDVRGRVASVEIVAPAAHESFNRAALAAARRERFRPARRGGQPVDYTLTFTYRFRLSDA